MKEKQKFASLRRPRFFEGQLLSAKDLEAEQVYFLEKQKRHNRGLHGYGVVSGMDVSSNNDVLIVSDGMALDSFGNEIVLPNCLEIPIKQRWRVAYVVARTMRVKPILCRCRLILTVGLNFHESKKALRSL